MSSERLGLALLVAAPAMAAAVALALAPLRRLLLKADLLDRPNQRSSHRVPTPRGAGLLVLPAVVLAWFVVDRLCPLPGRFWAIGVAALALVAISLFDDRRSVSPGLRFALHALAVGLGLWSLPADFSLTQGLLPRWTDLILAFLAWLWFLELTNFMDGIDGITGVEGGSIALGLLLLAMAGALPLPLAGALLLLIGALFGFLAWNWHPAAIFLGDSGSVPLGYLLGWLLLLAGGAGLWPVALILPLYYWADATWTLLARLRRGEKIWQAHRRHFYQRATQGSRGGGSHAPVAMAILFANLALIALALWSRTEPWGALAAAAAVVAVLLGWLGRRAAG
jgi:UDP-N-acetylmuramyl pentapeptide phosphotransferase/UDP-N-acetylglucosamine-1-phosphate transferase